ncbi:hypothetical protein BKA62DRAFT_761077 [Auriculariales sp. MPI-PUGE-AT-0066]|nr:hypothetical protein BKA62DRAFT_761077 [Auriculariales sp. MPI-PUGE-AT-0066]
MGSKTKVMGWFITTSRSISARIEPEGPSATATSERSYGAAERATLSAQAKLWWRSVSIRQHARAREPKLTRARVLAMTAHLPPCLLCQFRVLVPDWIPSALSLLLPVAIPTLPLAMNPSRSCQIRSNILRNTSEDCVPFVLMYHPACCPCLRDRLRLALITGQLAEVLTTPGKTLPITYSRKSRLRRPAVSLGALQLRLDSPYTAPRAQHLAEPLELAQCSVQLRFCSIEPATSQMNLPYSRRRCLLNIRGRARHRILLARSRSARVPAGTPRGIDLLAHLDQDRLSSEYLLLGRSERHSCSSSDWPRRWAQTGLEDLEPTAFGAELAHSL